MSVIRLDAELVLTTRNALIRIGGSSPSTYVDGITNEKDGLKNNLIFYKKFVIIFI